MVRPGFRSGFRSRFSLSRQCSCQTASSSHSPAPKVCCRRPWLGILGSATRCDGQRQSLAPKRSSGQRAPGKAPPAKRPKPAPNGAQGVHVRRSPRLRPGRTRDADRPDANAAGTRCGDDDDSARLRHRVRGHCRRRGRPLRPHSASAVPVGRSVSCPVAESRGGRHKCRGGCQLVWDGSHGFRSVSVADHE